MHTGSTASPRENEHAAAAPGGCAHIPDAVQVLRGEHQREDLVRARCQLTLPHSL
jgi:hypothetical protein